MGEKIMIWLTLLVNVIGLGLIVFVAWWFWFKRSDSKPIAYQQRVTIVVENGVYTPNIVRAKLGETLELNFLRKDKSPCAAVVLFHDFNIARELPIDKPLPILITPDKVGSFDFTCEMAMYRGTLIVE